MLLSTGHYNSCNCESCFIIYIHTKEPKSIHYKKHMFAFSNAASFN